MTVSWDLMDKGQNSRHKDLLWSVDIKLPVPSQLKQHAKVKVVYNC